MDNSSLAHTTWTCKYHIVFAPKYRRKIIYQKIRQNIVHILTELQRKNRFRYFVEVGREEGYIFL